MSYRTIVADPPWPIRGRAMGAGGRRRRPTVLPYPVMGIKAIEKLPVAGLAAEDAVLFLWATREVFREGTAARVARAWGFEPCGEVIWGLRNPGLGSGAIVNDHEPVLIARRGRGRLAAAVRGVGVVFWRQPYAGAGGKVHSAKPDGFLDLVESLTDEPRLELFARRQRIGWDTWGDEAREDVVLSLIGPERSEGPLLAPRRHPAIPVPGRGTAAHPYDTPALCDISASPESLRAGADRGSTGGGGG